MVAATFSRLKRYDEAFAAYDKALALKPDLAEAWLGRGNVFMNSSATTKPLLLMTKRWHSSPIWLKHGLVAVTFSLNSSDTTKPLLLMTKR